MNEEVRSRVYSAEMGFSRRTSGLSVLDKVKSADICESLKHRIAASPTRKIATASVSTCDTNVPGKNSKKTALFNSDWSKAQKPSLNSMARLR